MKKLLRFFRSRFFLGALCIILEFVQLIAVFVLLYEFVLPITIMAWIFHFVVLLYVINKNEIPEFKMPWLIIFFLLPVLGSFVFMLLSTTSTSKKEYLRAQKAEDEMKPFVKQSDQIEILKETDEDAWLQANYLYTQIGMPCCGNTSTVYYPLGEDFHAALLEELKKAEKFIFMEYFIVQKGAMWDPIYDILKEKAAMGVEVYFLYDDFGCFATLPWHYHKLLNDEGIHCGISNKFSPVLSRIHNNRDHRKITVIDGKVGFTGGVNLADEYINVIEKFGHWKDTAVKLEGEAVRNLMVIFLTNWNTQSKKDTVDFGKYMNEPVCRAEDNGIVIPFGSGPDPIYKDNVGKNVYLNMIHSAKRYLYITTPYLICDRELLNALCLAAQKGVDVRIITPHIPDKRTVFWMTRSNYQVLLNAGVRIFEYTPGFIHAKNFVCDDKFAVCGTLNLDYRSLVHHFECGAWMYETDCIPDMKEDFLNTMASSEEIINGRKIMRFWQRFIAEVLKVFSPMF
ncbi:MAG: cardiolipin synthase [Oscillospiraceae bacterium]|nr:cardiolipin synthase [Oscillospiraceae bacterium]